MSITDNVTLWILSLVHLAIPLVVDDVVVTTKYGKLSGRRLLNFYDIRDGGVTDFVDRFLGVPYAEPPVGKLRFQVSFYSILTHSELVPSRYRLNCVTAKLYVCWVIYFLRNCQFRWDFR